MVFAKKFFMTLLIGTLYKSNGLSLCRKKRIYVFRIIKDSGLFYSSVYMGIDFFGWRAVFEKAEIEEN